MTSDANKYWLHRFAEAIEHAVDAAGEQSRSAYMDLADHYWSMHLLVHGAPRPIRIRALPLRTPAAPGDAASPLRWAA